MDKNSNGGGLFGNNRQNVSCFCNTTHVAVQLPMMHPTRVTFAHIFTPPNNRYIAAVNCYYTIVYTSCRVNHRILDAIYGFRRWVIMEQEVKASELHAFQL